MSKISDRMANMFATFKGMTKVILLSRPVKYMTEAAPGSSLIIMGNGPSLAAAIAECRDVLETHPLMAVNFAANTEEFLELKPRYYVMADPVFFGDGNDNVARLWRRLSEYVKWEMTLFVPYDSMKKARALCPDCDIRPFNFVGVEGFDAVRHMFYRRRLGMPRPRNVLIPAIMIGLWLGFKEIYLTGADHSWTKTLDVSDDNEVISIQPHFYADNDSEHKRVASVYKNVRLHDVLLSFHIAFKAYFDIQKFAADIGARIYNATPGSFIDAFRRRKLSDLREK